MSPNVTGFPTVHDNLPITPNLTYSETRYGHCGIDRTWQTTDVAGNVATAVQQIRISSPNPPHVTINYVAMVPCGSLKEVTDLSLKPAIQVNHPCGLPVSIRYIDPSSASLCGTNFVRKWVISDGCTQDIFVNQTIQILNVQDPISPVRGQVNLNRRPLFQWPTYPETTRHKVFVWKFGTSRPDTPSGYTHYPSFRPSGNLDVGQKYYWQVEYDIEGGKSVLFSPRWNFKTLYLPDLVIMKITVPPLAHSGQSFQVQRTVQNKGNETIQFRTWQDAVYISFTKDVQSTRLVTRKIQYRTLLPTATYTDVATVRLACN